MGWVRMFQKLRYLGTIVKVVISKTTKRWFASITVDTFTDYPITHNRGLPVVGVDVGIKHLAVTSEGQYFENPKALKRYEHEMRRLQRQLSRRKKGNRNWHKTKSKIAKLHYRITCIRKEAQHQATTAIVNNASRIGIESLNVVGMLKNHRLAKPLSDASLSSLLSMLKYKVERLGVKIVEADTFYLSLSDRIYHCRDCSHTQDRDLNAAINLRNVAAGHAET